MTADGQSNLVLAAALINTASAVAKLIAAAATGSAALLAEAIHSIAAATSQAVLLAGMPHASDRRPRRARAPTDRELLFWAAVAPVLFYSLGAGVALNEGIDQLQGAGPPAEPRVGFIVLAAGLLIQAGLAYRARRQVQAAPVKHNPAGHAVLLESVAALAGLALALAGVAITYGLGWREADALASIAVALVMGAVASVMALRTKALLGIQAAVEQEQQPAAIDEPPAGEDVPGAEWETRAGGAPPSRPLTGADQDPIASSPRPAAEPPRKTYPPIKGGKGKRKRR